MDQTEYYTKITREVRKAQTISRDIKKLKKLLKVGPKLIGTSPNPQISEKTYRSRAASKGRRLRNKILANKKKSITLRIGSSFDQKLQNQSAFNLTNKNLTQNYNKKHFLFKMNNTNERRLLKKKTKKPTLIQKILLKKNKDFKKIFQTENLITRVNFKLKKNQELTQNLYREDKFGNIFMTSDPNNDYREFKEARIHSSAQYTPNKFKLKKKIPTKLNSKINANILQYRKNSKNSIRDFLKSKISDSLRCKSIAGSPMVTQNASRRIFNNIKRNKRANTENKKIRTSKIKKEQSQFIMKDKNDESSYKKKSPIIFKREKINQRSPSKDLQNMTLESWAGKTNQKFDLSMSNILLKDLLSTKKEERLNI